MDRLPSLAQQPVSRCLQLPRAIAACFIPAELEEVTEGCEQSILTRSRIPKIDLIEDCVVARPSQRCHGSRSHARTTVGTSITLSECQRLRSINPRD